MLMKTIAFLMSFSLLSIWETPTANEVFLQLSCKDNSKRTQLFLEELVKYGFKLHEVDFKRQLGRIKKLELELSHQSGMEWTVNLNGFRDWRLRFLLDTNGNPIEISYKIDRERATKGFKPGDWVDIFYEARHNTITHLYYIF